MGVYLDHFSNGGNVKLLTVGNPKLLKGQKKGYLSFILHLAPASLSGYNVCPNASDGCKAACLNTAGRGGMFKAGTFTNIIQEARKRKTVQFFENRSMFLSTLVADVELGIKQATKKNRIPCFRLNGTSDLRWEVYPVVRDGVTYPNIMIAFPDIQFYDYTKLDNRKNLPSNYHLTFSLSENNDAIAVRSGMNIATVFKKDLPSIFSLEGVEFDVVNGDDTDLRFLDPSPVIVGLKSKGRGKKDTSGFVR